VLEKTFEESSSKNSLDIMKLSFDLVKNIEKEKDFASYDEGVYQGRVKLMCEADVHLNENFSLRMKGQTIDSDAKSK
jgi:hypothetical protein